MVTFFLTVYELEFRREGARMIERGQKVDPWLQEAAFAVRPTADKPMVRDMRGEKGIASNKLKKILFMMKGPIHSTFYPTRWKIG